MRVFRYKGIPSSLLGTYIENNSVKHVDGVTVPSLCTSSDDALCMYHDKNLQRDKLYRNVGGVTVLDLCKLSGDALYLYKVSCKYLKGF